MLRVVNRTPYRTQLFGALDVERRDVAVIVVKGTFTLDRGVARVADEQAAIVVADEHHGDPTSSSVRYESDLAPEKRATDVVLNGTAYAPRRAAEALVSVQVGPVAKTLRVLGERRWVRDALGRLRASAPQPFEQLPLLYESAFGGTDPGAKQDGAPAAGPPGDARNPVGVGFIAKSSRTDPADVAVPRIEDPQQPITSPQDQPAPAGVGFVHRAWWPRSHFGGTYDAAWTKERAPFLPLDFNPQFHQGASAGLVARGFLRGDEPVRALGVTPTGHAVEFRLPGRAIEAVVRTAGQDLSLRANLDTVVLEPDLDRVLCTWRALYPCPRKLLRIERVTVKELPA
ncbi:MAG: DUF2169 domain-containing protein [Polyangiaceae bacterium]